MNIKKLWKKIINDLNEYKIGRTNLTDISVKALLFIAMLVLLPILFSSDRITNFSDMRVGSISTRKVVAPFNFYILKTDKELAVERDEAVKKVPYYFIFSDSVYNLQEKQFTQIIPFLIKNKPSAIVNDSTEIIWNQEILRLKEELMTRYNFEISAANLNILYNFISNKENRTKLQSIGNEVLKELKKGISDIGPDHIKRENIVVIKRGIEEQIEKTDFVSIDTLRKDLDEKLRKNFSENELTILNIYFSRLLQPTLIFDKELTRNSVDAAINSVALTKDMVFKDELIVDKNLRIDEKTFQKLYSLEYALLEQSRREDNWQEVLSYTGKMALLAAILFVYGLYLYSFRRKILNDNRKILLISIIIIIQAIFAAIFTVSLDWPIYVIPTTISSMLLAILIDSGIAFTGTIVIGLFLGGIQGGGYELTLYTIVAGMAGIFAVHRIRTRNQVFKAILYISLAYIWVLAALTSIRFESMTEALRIFVYYLLPNALLSSFITFMVLGIFEKMFDITTDVTLLELSDLNHPLLKRLSLEAPGTFHHSMIVGNLSEAAAKAINGNPLLARVGSYYHDIGKMEKPEYFIENLMDADNRHNALAPSMSALILASHVKNGLELARKYGIPKLIRDFIPEHHGTSLMTYFYNKAKESFPEKDINEADFRYPGPRPQSKETGITMLADAVEAATRTIKNPTLPKVRAFVEDIVDKRFKEGELDECDLTLKDLKSIIDAFMTILSGVFQHRIEYPDTDKKKTDNKKGNKRKIEEPAENKNLSEARKS
ncbi:MAG: HDIG domain-containing protein [Calditrichaceae bacterium]|nr:HDIG domain-containing protein [Calditrichaceae bacterium]MBN2709597.1 HDIG domain-containing protein [Calditrichaceae bacterium]RQV92395.1 MAG: HDIG domain-containing protein [Calditrichota bacterium]